MIRKLIFVSAILVAIVACLTQAQTVIPNSGFENWTTTGNYTDPTGWDTPNQELMAIPFFGFPVVTKSTDHQGTGSYSAKLETKHLSLPPMDIPGFMTCGKLVVNITNGTYVLSGGAPCNDQPTHLKGYFKYSPKGGDSCVIGIGLTRTVAGVQDTIGMGSFSSKDTVSDWTPFSAWIDYISTNMPDTMNIIAMSTAQEVMTPGTILYVDNLFLDYTVSTRDKPAEDPIQVYNDRETKRVIIFVKNNEPEPVSVALYNMAGQRLNQGKLQVKSDRMIISYQSFSKGVYLLEVLQGKNRFVEKLFLNNL